MRFTSARRAYESLPGWLAAPVGWLPFRWIAGRHYRTVLRRGAQLDQASREELLAYQEKALGDILRFACDQVPAYVPYRGLVERLRPREALRGFPLLDKAQLQADLPRYLPRDFACIPHYEATTGGTSGNQLQFYVDDHSQAVEIAFIHRQWARVGYSPSCRKATFRGVNFRRLRPGVFWQANPVYNELQFSPYHMNEDTLGCYWRQLQRYQPEFLHGYPSAISLLAEYVLRHQLPNALPRLRAVLLGSEAVLPGQRQLMERAFHTRVYTWYGHSERVILGGECEKNDSYHHFPDYGVLEILDDDGCTVEPEGPSGELVGTGLLNRCLPLIRYKTGDRARRLPWQCECGRAFDRFDQVEGRWQQEYVIGKNGSKISLAALNMHGPHFQHVIRYQYYQRIPGHMELRLMVSEHFDAREEKQLHDALRHKTGDELAVTVRVVDDIPLTARGKLRRLIQELPQNALAGNRHDAA